MKFKHTLTIFFAVTLLLLNSGKIFADSLTPSIFEKGVTVWSDPLDINTLDIGDNKPLEGVPL